MPPSFWPKPNRFRVALRQGGPPPVAMWITLQSANVVEMVGAHGVDTVILDLEHTASSPGDLQPMVVAAQLAGMTALVRPAGADRHEIGRLLDAGADGIVFPMVSSAGEAAAAARAVRYPPAGCRGWAGAHARHVLTTGYDRDASSGEPYSTNLSLEEAMKPDVLLVHTVDGAPLPPEHGGPCRMITPQLYAWKGAKWIRRITLTAEDRLGFWERRGYSATALPWYDDRYSRR